VPRYRSRADGDAITDPDAHGKSDPNPVDQPKPYVHSHGAGRAHAHPEPDDPASELRDAVALADAVKSNPYATDIDVLTVCAAIHGPASRYLAALDDRARSVPDDVPSD